MVLCRRSTVVPFSANPSWSKAASTPKGSPCRSCMYTFVMDELPLLWTCWWVGLAISPACSKDPHHLLQVYWAVFWVLYVVERPSCRNLRHTGEQAVTQPGYVQITAVTATGALKVRCCPHNQLCGVIFLFPPFTRAGVTLLWYWSWPGMPTRYVGTGAAWGGGRRSLLRLAVWVGSVLRGSLGRDT